MPPIFSPQAILPDPHEALHADLADARRHTARFHRLAARERILAFDPGITGDTLLADPGRPPIHGFLIRTLLDTFLIPPAPVLVDQDDAVFRPLVNGLPGTGRQAAGIGAVIADALEIEEEGLMLWKAAPGHFPGFIPREPGLVDTFDERTHRGGRVFVDVDEPP